MKNPIGEAKRMLKTKLSAKERKTLVNDARKKTYPGVKEEVLLFSCSGRGFSNLKIVSKKSICRQQQVQLNSWELYAPPTFFHGLLLRLIIINCCHVNVRVNLKNVHLTCVNI